MAIKYSVIIPHKDIPCLLNRCLASIPIRGDIQTIVVDDNSSSDTLSMLHDMEEKYPHVCFRYDKSGLGAGHARNIGLSRAKGDWLLFSDADDFFESSYWKEINRFDSEAKSAEIIYFGVKGVDSETLEPSSRGLHLYNYVLDYVNKNVSEETLRYKHLVPWGKMIRRSLIENRNIRFEEVLSGNDIMFCLQAGFYASSIEAYDLMMYNVTSRAGSLSTLPSPDVCRSRFEVKIRQRIFLYKNGLIAFAPNLFLFVILYTRRFGVKEGFWYMNKMVENKINPLSGAAGLLFKYVRKIRRFL